MKPILIAQKMTDIDDRFILGSAPAAIPVADAAPVRPAMRDFFSHGWGVAIIAGLVAFGVLAGIIAAGQQEPDVLPADSDDTSDTVEAPTETETEAMTEPESELETADIMDTPEEAAARQEELYALLDALDFKWNITVDPEYYFNQYEPIKQFGIYGVPYMLEYVMQYEEADNSEETLTRLGIILHFAYHNVGITNTYEWYHADDGNTLDTDVFKNTKYFIDHHGEHGLTMPNEETFANTQEATTPSILSFLPTRPQRNKTEFQLI